MKHIALRLETGGGGQPVTVHEGGGQKGKQKHLDHPWLLATGLIPFNIK